MDEAEIRDCKLGAGLCSTALACRKAESADQPIVPITIGAEFYVTEVTQPATPWVPRDNKGPLDDSLSPLLIRSIPVSASLILNRFFLPLVSPVVFGCKVTAPTHLLLT